MIINLICLFTANEYDQVLNKRNKERIQFQCTLRINKYWANALLKFLCSFHNISPDGTYNPIIISPTPLETLHMYHTLSENRFGVNRRKIPKAEVEKVAPGRQKHKFPHKQFTALLRIPVVIKTVPTPLIRHQCRNPRTNSERIIITAAERSAPLMKEINIKSELICGDPRTISMIIGNWQIVKCYSHYVRSY